MNRYIIIYRSLFTVLRLQYTSTGDIKVHDLYQPTYFTYIIDKDVLCVSYFSLSSLSLEDLFAGHTNWYFLLLKCCVLLFL